MESLYKLDNKELVPIIKECIDSYNKFHLTTYILFNYTTNCIYFVDNVYNEKHPNYMLNKTLAKGYVQGFMSAKTGKDIYQLINS